MAMYSWRSIGIFLFVGCNFQQETKEISQTEALVQASDEVIFASVEQLGTHASVSTLLRQEFHGEDLRSEHREILEIAWMDWDNFQSTRRVDDEVVSDVIVSKSATYDFRGGVWQSRPDGEPYRVQLRSTWNQWDDVLRHFDEHLKWTAVAIETVEGRKTQKYVADFKRPEDSKGNLKPYSFEGTMWVDEQTAVRILGEIRATLRNGPYKKTLRLQIERKNIGVNIEITTPVF